MLRISRPNARFQQWHSLLRHQSKRRRAGEFLVQGVRPITQAVELGWPLRAVIYNADRPLSRWAAEIVERAGGERVAMTTDLLRALAEKDDQVPELVVVAELPDDDLARIRVDSSFLAVVFDRPSSPGNIGTMLRSVDAFGGAGLIVTGHGADPYDPRSLRASTGSLLAVPVVRVPSHRHVLGWARSLAVTGGPPTVIGTDENGSVDIADVDLTGPVLLVVGNETTGLSAAWRQECDTMAQIPIAGTASSINAAGAATVALYEAARQRRRVPTR